MHSFAHRPASIRRALLSAALLLAAGLAFLPGNARPARADHVLPPPIVKTYTVNFSTTGQSMWGPGTQAVLPPTTAPIIDQGFSGSAGGGRIESVKVGDVGGDFGAEVSGSVGGSVGLDVVFRDFGEGTVDATYPASVVFQMPSPETYRAGDTITVTTSWAARPGGTIGGTFANGFVDLNGSVAVNASASVKGCVFSCDTFSLFSMNESASATVVTASAPGTFYVDPVTSLLTGLFGWFGRPDPAPSTTLTGNNLSAFGADEFMDMQLDMDKWATFAAGLPPLGLQFPNVSDDFAAGYEVLDVRLHWKLRTEQRFDLVPTITVHLVFPQALNYTIHDGANVTTGTGTSVEFPAGASLDLDIPASLEGSLDIVPTFRLDNSFSSSTTLKVNDSVDIKALELTAKVPSVGICCDVSSPAINLGTVGPAFEVHPDVLNVSLPVFSGSWELQGFSDIVGEALVVDPVYDPTAVMTGPTTITEGDVANFGSGASSDFDNDIVARLWDFGDSFGASGFNASHAYPDDGAFTVTLDVRDAHDTVDTDSQVLTVLNAAPVLEAGVDRSVDEGSVLSLSSGFFGANLLTNGDAESGAGGWDTFTRFGSPTSSGAASLGGMVVESYAPLSEQMLADTGFFGANVLVNPGADAGGTSGWTSFLVGTQTYSAGAPLTLASPGPTDRGTSYFQPTTANFLSRITQNVALPAALADEGDMTYHVSGWLGSSGWPDATGVEPRVNGGLVAGGIGFQCGSCSDALFFRDGSVHPLPVGARTFQFSNWFSNPTFGSGGDPTKTESYSDSLSLVLGLPAAYDLNGTTVSGFPRLDQPGSPTRGTSFFRGPSQASGGLAQIIDVSEVAGLIDQGLVTYDLAAYLGGFGGQDDTAFVRARFVDDYFGDVAAAASIGETDPVDAAARGGASSLLLRESSGVVPAGTRKIEVQIRASRVAGIRADGYIDDVSLTLFGPDSAFISDAGLLDTHSLAVNWGDGSAVEAAVIDQEPGLAFGYGAHVYAENGLYNVAAVASDDDGGTSTDTFAVTVNNVAPSVTVTAPVYVIDRAATRLVATFTDPGVLDTHTSTIDWGDGSAPQPGVVANGQVIGTHTYASTSVPGPYPATRTVTITVVDDDGGTTVAGGTATIAALEIPAISAGPDQASSEGQPVTFSGSFAAAVNPVTPGVDDAVTRYEATWDFGDGTVVGPVVVTPGAVVASHTYADEGAYTATLSVRAFDGARLAAGASAPALITVSNAPAVVTATGDSTADEGGPVAVSVSFTDPGIDDAHTAFVQWGDGDASLVLLSEAAGAGTGSASHVYADNGSYTVTARVIDDAGAEGTATLVVVVANVAPSVTAPAGITRSEGSPFSLGAGFDDPGSADTHTVVVDWGDGTLDEGGPGLLSSSHTYADDGDYTATVTVTDDDGGVGTASLVVTIANLAPTVEFVGAPVIFEVAVPMATVVEGATFNLTNVTFDDRGVLDTAVAALIDWGDGTTSAGVIDNLTRTVSGAHVYADDGGVTGFDDSGAFLDEPLRPITVTVTDDDGGEGTNRAYVRVLNAPPAVAPGPDIAGAEGATVTLAAAGFTDPGSADTHTATVDWGDGSAPEAAAVGTGNTLSASHAYEDDGAYVVVLTVADDDGGAGQGALIARIANAAPAVTAAGPASPTAEGAGATVTASFTDAGVLDTHFATIDWGDGTVEPVSHDAATGTLSASHVFPDDGGYAVTVEICDIGNACGSDTTTVVVTNVDPVLDAGPDRTVEEGTPVYAATAALSDAGFDCPACATVEGFTGDVDWGDGTTDLGVGATVTVVGEPGIATRARLGGSHTYANNGVFTVAVSAADDDGGVSGPGSFIVTVLNAAPVVDAGPDVTIDEGDVLALSPATFTDAGSADTHTATIDWGDGSPLEAGAVDDLAGTVSGSHPYANEGAHVLTVCVTDDDGATGCDTASVEVLNVAPAVGPIDDATIAEGGTFALAVDFTDPGLGDTHDLTIDWGDGTVVSTSVPPSDRTVSGTHVYADDGVYALEVCVTDDAGGQGCSTATVVVGSVPPTVDAGPDVEAIIDEPVTLAAAFTDPGFDCPLCGTAEDFTAVVDWGDGTTEAPAVTEAPGAPGVLTAGSLTAVHVYSVVGVYTVAVTVTDDDGASATDLATIRVSGARAFKLRALDDLRPFAGESKRIAEAIEDLEESLAPELWVDETHVDPKHGKKVFDRERQAVKDLQKAVEDTEKGKKEALGPDAHARTVAAIDDLVTADRMLATTLLDDVEGLTAADPDDQGHVDRDLSRAVEELVKGDAARADGDADKAIEHYRKAWQDGQKALKTALDLSDDDDADGDGDEGED